jgi:hypothetical protein
MMIAEEYRRLRLGLPVYSTLHFRRQTSSYLTVENNPGLLHCKVIGYCTEKSVIILQLVKK